MAKVIRVKRSLDLDPAEAIILSSQSKRTRLSTEDAAEFSKILKYAGTVASQDDPVEDLLSKALKTPKTTSRFTGAKHVKRPIESLKEKLRDDTKSCRKEMRYTLVSTQRGLNTPLKETSTETDTEIKQLFKLYDVISEDENVGILTSQFEEQVQEITCNGVPMSRHKVNREGANSGKDFVYDLYFIEGKELDENLIQDQTLSIAPVPNDDIYYRENEGGDDDNSDCEDDDDSNDENNWRNDYPEENSDFEKEMDYRGDYDDDELIARVAECEIDDPEGDDDDSVEELITYAAFDKEVYNNGLAYAKFKASFLNPNHSSEDDDDDGDDECADYKLT